MNTKSKAYRAIEKGARAEQLSKALSVGFGSVDVLLPRHVTSRTPVVDFAGPSYQDRFVRLPDGLCVTRAAVAIAAIWGSIELRRCRETRSLAKRDSVSVTRFQTSPQTSSVSESPNQARLNSKNPEIAQNLDAPSVQPVRISSSANSASGSLPKTIQNMNSDNFRTSNSCVVRGNNSAHAWLECVSSSLCETELSVGPLRSTIQILSTLPLVASTVDIPIMSVYDSYSLLGSCFHRAPSEPNRVNPVLPKHGDSPKLRSVPRAAILAKVNSRLLFRASEHNPSTNEKMTDNENISASTPAPTKQAEGGSNEASKLEFEMKIPNLAKDVVCAGNQQLTVGYKSRLAAPHSHWNKLLKSLEAKEEVEEATGYAKKSDMAKTSTPLSAQLTKRKQKSEQRQINRRRLQTKAQLTSGVKRRSSSSGTLSSSMRTSTTKTLSSNRRPVRKSKVGNPIRDWSSAELSLDGDELHSPSNKKTGVRKHFERDQGGTTQSLHGTLSNGSKRINNQKGRSTVLERKLEVRKFAINDDLRTSSWVMKMFSEALMSTEDTIKGSSGELKGTENDYCRSVFQKIATSSRRRVQSSMFAVSEASDDSLSYIAMQESIKSNRNSSKVDLFKSNKLNILMLNKFISANKTNGSKFVRSLVGDGDINLSSPIHAPKRNRAELEILSDHNDDKESSFERAGANPGKNESSYSMASKVDHESEHTKAIGLQQRVCGNLFESMSAADQEKVGRWALRDFSDFLGTDDIMEVTLNVKSVNCERCGTTDAVTGMCEESIVLKLWKDMTWRKVRRLRHVLGSDA